MALERLSPDEERNRLLRRVDWRFLLPNPWPTQTICFADNRLAQAIALISTRVVKEAQGAIGESDLAVAVDPAPATLTAAATALRPGGALYVEWNFPLPGQRHRMRRELEALGFSEVTYYWPWPWPQQTRPPFSVPLEAPKAVSNFLAVRPEASARWRFIKRLALPLLWRLAQQTPFLTPLCMTAIRPVIDDANLPNIEAIRPTVDSPNAQISKMDDATEASLIRFVREKWAGWGLGAKPPDPVCILLTGGARGINKVVAQIRDGLGEQPVMIIKFPRLPESVAGLRREATALQAVQAARPNGMPSVPRLLFWKEQGSQIALGETALAGDPLFTLLNLRTYREIAIRVTDWLIDLAAPARPSLPLTAPRVLWWDRLVESALADYAQAFGNVTDPASLTKIRARLTQLSDLPLICEQRDCSPWNILLGADLEPVVLDWESAELEGLPGLDLIYFLTYQAFFMEGAMQTGQFRETYRRTLDSATFIGQVVAECQQRYLTALNIEAGVLQPLRLLTWLIHSRSEYRQMWAATAGTPPPETLRCSLFVSLIAEELGCTDCQPA